MSEDETNTESDYHDWQELCGPEEFDALIGETVSEDAPRVFAVVQELGERLDGRVAAWGMAFEDGAHLVSVEGDATHKSRSAEDAARLYARRATPDRPAVTARVVWR